MRKPPNKKGAAATATPKISSALNDTRLAYTMREVGNLIGLSERSVWALCSRGELRSVKLGRSVRIPADAVAELLGGRS